MKKWMCWRDHYEPFVYPPRQHLSMCVRLPLLVRVSAFINLLNHKDGSFSVIISMILFSGKYPLIFYSKFILISWPAADPIHLMASGYLQYVCEWEMMINIFNNFVGWENKRIFNDLVVIFYITLHYTRTRSNSDSSRG